MPKSIALPGINTEWQLQATNVEAALSDVGSLLDQALAVFMEATDFPLPQWGAVQQLTMAAGLVGAVHETMLKLKVVSE
jgi:hypothetical protein